MARKRPEYDEKLVKRIARKLRELYYGPKTYSKIIKPKRKKKITTIRTKATEKSLKHSGLTERDIAKLRD